LFTYIFIQICKYTCVHTYIHTIREQVFNKNFVNRAKRVLTCICLRAGGLLVKFPPTVDVITRMRNTKES